MGLADESQLCVCSRFCASACGFTSMFILMPSVNLCF